MFLDLRLGALVEALTKRRWEPDLIATEMGRRITRFQRLGLARGDRVFLTFGNRLASQILPAPGSSGQTASAAPYDA